MKCADPAEYRTKTCRSSGLYVRFHARDMGGNDATRCLLLTDPYHELQ